MLFWKHEPLTKRADLLRLILVGPIHVYQTQTVRLYGKMRTTIRRVPLTLSHGYDRALVDPPELRSHKHHLELEGRHQKVSRERAHIA